MGLWVGGEVGGWMRVGGVKIGGEGWNRDLSKGHQMALPGHMVAPVKTTLLRSVDVFLRQHAAHVWILRQPGSALLCPWRVSGCVWKQNTD